MASVEASWFGNATFDASASLSFTLAPQSAVAAVGAEPTTYCPLHSVMQGVTASSAQGASALRDLRITGFDQPLPTDPLPSGCAVPDCAAMGGCQKLGLQIAALSTEPIMLQRDVLRWLRDVGLSGPSKSLVFQPPPLDLYNPALNRSDWAPTDLLCDLDLRSYTLPALPYTNDTWTSGLRMPFPPPGGLLHCLSDVSDLQAVDWSAARFFSSDMLADLSTVETVALTLDLEALYGGVRPVPAGFFDPLQSTVSVQGQCASSCARVAMQCPFFVRGTCQPCPPGFFKRIIQGQYAYCSACPAGSYCDSAVSANPVICPRGSYQHERGQTSCLLCSAGQ